MSKERTISMSNLVIMKNFENLWTAMLFETTKFLKKKHLIFLAGFYYIFKFSNNHGYMDVSHDGSDGSRTLFIHTQNEYASFFI